MKNRTLIIVLRPKVHAALARLQRKGLHGQHIGETAERLICEKLRELTPRPRGDKPTWTA